MSGSVKQFGFWMASALAVLTMASLAAVGLVASTSSSVAATTTGRAVPAVIGTSGPLYTKTSGPDAAGLFSCQAPESASNPVPCFSPSQIRSAYNVPNYLTGAGETIVIIDAYGDPYIASDLALFDSTFRLPPARLNIICVASPTTTGPCPTFSLSTPTEVGWAGEIAVDTQWSHAIAPAATIDLVVARSTAAPSLSTLLTAQQYVVDKNLGDVLSQSWGENELCVPKAQLGAMEAVFQQAEAEHISVFASAGDSGAANFNCTFTGYIKGVNMPASDPLVTSVGGTHLNANYISGTYYGETIWNDSGQTPDFGAGGGGFSSIFARPSYQNSAHTGSAFRGVPDVTYNADVYNGMLSVCSACNAGTQAFFIFGGTSLGSPQWAAIAALADQAAGHRLGFLNPTLYAILASPLYYLAFHDITVGNNSWAPSGITGYSASPGWDPASGIGSPNAAVLINLLAG